MSGKGKFETVEELEKSIGDYFESLEYKDAETQQVMHRPATMTGLALALGFCSRQSLYDYEGRDAFSYTIKIARLRVENSYEEHLFTKSCTGAIFGLKNLGWKDKVETEFSGLDAIQINIVKPRKKRGEDDG